MMSVDFTENRPREGRSPLKIVVDQNLSSSRDRSVCGTILVVDEDETGTTPSAFLPLRNSIVFLFHLIRQNIGFYSTVLGKFTVQL